MNPAQSLSVTLDRLDKLIRELGIRRSQVLDARDLAARTALPEHIVRALLNGDVVAEGTVNDRVRGRIRALADAYLERSGKPMSDLAAHMSRQLGISAVWARHICTGTKMPSVELLHAVVGFFGVEGGEAFFTSPATDALNKVLLGILDDLQPAPEGASVEGDSHEDDAGAGLTGRCDVRGLALRQARELPPERWNVLNATLQALLELDETEEAR